MPLCSRRLRGWDWKFPLLQGCFPWQPAPIHTWPRGHSKKLPHYQKGRKSPHHLGSSQAFWSSVPETRWRPIYIFLNTNHNITGTLADHKLPPGGRSRMGCILIRALPLFFADSHLIHPLISAWPLRSLSEENSGNRSFLDLRFKELDHCVSCWNPLRFAKGFYLTERELLNWGLKFFLWVIALELFQFCQFWKAWV